MKILIICYVYPPEVAPAGVMVKELAEYLTAKAHQVTVQTGWPNHPHGELYAGYAMKWRQVQREGSHAVQRVAMMIANKESPIRRFGVYASFAASSLANGWSLGRQDVVVCLSTPLVGVWTAWAMARLWRARFVNVIFDLWPETIRNAGLISEGTLYKIVRRIDAANCRWSDAISVLGQGMKDQVMARGLAEEDVDVIPFWIDTERIRPTSRDNAWRREYDIPLDKFIVLFAGTIGYVSGAQILAETAEKLANRKDILLLVVGEGVVKAELEQLARDRGVTNMRFLPFQPAERLEEVQGTADVGLVTLLPDSGISSVPSKVLGYMAAGRPVIASAPADTDTARLVSDIPCGLVCDVQDPGALAKAIVRMADDESARLQWGRNARKYVEDNLSRTQVVSRYERMILGG